MNALLHKVWALTVAELALTSAYRATLFIWMLSGTLSVVMMLVWMGQAAASPAGHVNGFTPQAFAAYFLASWLMNELVTTWVSGEVSYQIRTGSMSAQLLRPIDPIWAHFAAHIGEWLVRLLPMTVIFMLGAWLTGAQFAQDVRPYLIAALLVGLGFMIRFLMEYCVGLISFWTDNTDAFYDLSWLAYTALGGMFAPLSFFPQWVQQIASWTPFPYLIGLPAELISGSASAERGQVGVLILGGWLLALLPLRGWLFKRGLTHYGAVGA